MSTIKFTYMKLNVQNIFTLTLIGIIVLLLLTKGCGEKTIVKDTLLQHKIDSLNNIAGKQKDSLQAYKLDRDAYNLTIDSLKRKLAQNKAEIKLVYVNLPASQQVINKLSNKQLEYKLATTYNTDTVKPFDSLVAILPTTARAALITYDSLEATKNELTLWRGNEEFYLQIQQWQDSVIQSQYFEIEAYDRLVATKDATIKSLEKQSADCQKQNKKVKRKTKLFQLIALGLLGALAIK